MNRYWMVNRPGTGSSYQHPTFESAKAEAERLAQQYPGVVFFILEATHAVRKKEVDVIDLNEYDGVPF